MSDGYIQVPANGETHSSYQLIVLSSLDIIIMCTYQNYTCMLQGDQNLMIWQSADSDICIVSTSRGCFDTHSNRLAETIRVSIETY